MRYWSRKVKRSADEVKINNTMQIRNGIRHKKKTPDQMFILFHRKGKIKDTKFLIIYNCILHDRILTHLK